jgi:CheY-like chemotaxis protein
MDAALTTPHGPIWHGATVLVVDDEPALRQVVRRTLEAEGFQVEEAPDGASALRLVQARAEPFDLVLTDLSMPHIDGRQLSETLSRYRPGVALLGMSADPDAVPQSSRRTRPSGCCSSHSPPTTSTTRCVTRSAAPPILAPSLRQRLCGRMPD